MISDIELGYPRYCVTMKDQAHYMVQAIANPIKYLAFNESTMNTLLEKLMIQEKNTVLYPYRYYFATHSRQTSVVNLNFRRRMEHYKVESQRLAYATLDQLFARIDANSVTHIVTCSCTGAFAPGLHDLIASNYNMRKTCKRFGINYMGCHGGVKAAMVARALAQEAVGNRVLLVCIELCTMHNFVPRLSGDAETIKMDCISNLLFADGCAAIIVDHYASSPSSSSSSLKSAPAALELVDSWTLAINKTDDNMTWEAQENQFVMFIDKRIKNAIESELPSSLNAALIASNCAPFSKERYDIVVHPGGPSILRSVKKALKLDDIALAPSFAVLERCGNMSSPTVFYVLVEYLRTARRAEQRKDILLLAFGPGLTIEVVLIRVNDAALKPLLLQANQAHATRLATKRVFQTHSPTGRSYLKEVMDTPLTESDEYTLNDYNAAMSSLNLMHRILFFNGSFYALMRRFAPRTVSEIGCGGGYLAKRVANLLPNASVLAVDRNPLAIELSNRTASPSNLKFAIGDDDRQVDVVYVSDVIHHMDDNELTEFLRYQYARATMAVVILDLHRHWLATLLFIIPAMLLCNWLARVDGYTSISRAFTRTELFDAAVKSGVPANCNEISWIWPFRWQLVLNKKTKRE